MQFIAGGLKDADRDYKIGTKNIALKTGLKSIKIKMCLYQKVLEHLDLV